MTCVIMYQPVWSYSFTQAEVWTVQHIFLKLLLLGDDLTKYAWLSSYQIQSLEQSQIVPDFSPEWDCSDQPTTCLTSGHESKPSWGKNSSAELNLDQKCNGRLSHVNASDFKFLSLVVCSNLCYITNSRCEC